jgi:AcrR family transcriptional regulator
MQIDTLMPSWHLCVMNLRRESLRQRQAQQVRAAILEAALVALEEMTGDELSMVHIARLAGVSLRTVYRHFSDRAALLEAAGNHLYASLDVAIDIAAPEDIASSFRVAARQLSKRPKLARALVQSRAGRASRSRVRSQRVQAISGALEQLTGGVEPGAAVAATAIITHLCSAAAWVQVAEESGLSDEQAQEAVAWAIETLVSSLKSQVSGRRRDKIARRSPHEELS